MTTEPIRHYTIRTSKHENPDDYQPPLPSTARNEANLSDAETGIVIPKLTLDQIESARLTCAERAIAEGWSAAELADFLEMCGLDPAHVETSRHIDRGES